MKHECPGAAVYAVATAVGMLAATAADAASTYSCQRLQLPADVLHAYAQGINARGEVVGRGHTARWGFSPTPLRWKKDGTVVRLTRSDRYSTANGINDAGDIVGWQENKQGSCCPGNALLWTNGVSTNLGAQAGRHEGANAQAINNGGQIVGVGRMMDGAWQATLWVAGHVIDLGSLAGAASSVARAINDDGKIVGESDTPDGFPHAVIWTDDVITDLGTLPGGSRSAARAINRQGTVVGDSEFAGGQPYQTHAVAWKDGAIRDLGTLPGHVTSGAGAINRAGTAVGTSQGASLPSAVIWPGLGKPPIDLNALVLPEGCMDEAGLAWSLENASAINDKGEIVAGGSRVDEWNNRWFRPFKLIPR